MTDEDYLNCYCTRIKLAMHIADEDLENYHKIRAAASVACYNLSILSGEDERVNCYCARIKRAMHIENEFDFTTKDLPTLELLGGPNGLIVYKILLARLVR